MAKFGILDRDFTRRLRLPYALSEVASHFSRQISSLRSVRSPHPHVVKDKKDPRSKLRAESYAQEVREQALQN